MFSTTRCSGDAHLVDVTALLSLLEQDHCVPWRERVLTQVIEPCLLAGDVTDELVDRFRQLRALDSDPPYALASLITRPDVRQSTRVIAHEAVRNRFPLAERVGPRLRDRRTTCPGGQQHRRCAGG